MSDAAADKILELAAREAEATTSYAFSFSEELPFGTLFKNQTGNVSLEKPGMLHRRQTFSTAQGRNSIDKEIISDGKTILILNISNRMYWVRDFSFSTICGLGMSYIDPDTIRSLRGRVRYVGTVDVDGSKLSQLQADVPSVGFQICAINESHFIILTSIYARSSVNSLIERTKIFDLRVNPKLPEDEFVCKVPDGFVRADGQYSLDSKPETPTAGTRESILSSDAFSVVIPLSSGATTTIRQVLTSHPFVLLILALPDEPDLVWLSS